MGTILKNKKITLGVTGAISAYKALELTRLLIKEGADVYPVMTKAATEFITPLSLSTLSKNPVSTALFDLTGETKISHIDLAQSSDLIIVAPATANIIGKVANGLADDLLSTLLMAAKAPVLLAPSMNSQMWANPVVQANVKKLEKLGFFFVGPSEGDLACGYKGTGRLASVEEIFEAAEEALIAKDLKGEKVLVTAGPTREAIDPVRYVSNASSGKMGYAVAKAARRRGAEVVLVSGPSFLPRPAGVTFVPVRTAEEMLDACVSYFPQSTIVIMAAAVADYRPTKSYPSKVKKDARVLSLEMERTQDVLKHLGTLKKKGQTLIGFALETDNIEENARKKLKEKGLDLVVANTPAGLDSDTNQVTILSRDGLADRLPPLPKEEVADRILDRALK